MKTIEALTQSVGVVAETYQYLKRSNQPKEEIEHLKQEWSQRILSRLNVEIELKGMPSKENSILFVGNHISYLDIPLLMSTTKNLSFVAKSEISQWPVFGEAAKKIDTVFVKRENKDSRKSARDSIKSALHAGKRIVIFPSGTTCLRESRPWKRGAFEIAKEANVLIQPFRISYSPLRAAAYIDKDFFPTHLINLFRQNQIQATIEFHKPTYVNDPAWDCLQWAYWSRGLLDHALI